MNCDEARRFLQDYVTRELDPERRRLFDAHLVECGECQRELALMTAVVSTLDHQPVLEPTPGFSRKVLASLPRQQRGFLLSPWWSVALAPMLAGAVWLFRVPLERELVAAMEKLGPEHVVLPALSMRNAGVAAAAIAGLGLLVAAGAVVFCWRVYLRD
jgi:anti-sigma factor RsiW